MFASQRLWSELTPFQVIKLVTVDKRHPPIPSSLHKDLASVLERCMSFKPEKRPSIVEVGEILLQLRDRMTPLASAEEKRAHERNSTQPWSLPALLVTSSSGWQDGAAGSPDANLRMMELDDKVFHSVLYFSISACVLCVAGRFPRKANYSITFAHCVVEWRCHTWSQSTTASWRAGSPTTAR